jgi:hypothetical protein
MVRLLASLTAALSYQALATILLASLQSQRILNKRYLIDVLMSHSYELEEPR